MVLKDIKNDPSVKGGLKRPLGSLKRRISESECQSSLPCKSKFGRGDQKNNIDCGFPGSRSEKNMNICTDLTNTPLAPQDKGRNESVVCRTEISVQGVLKNNNCIASPVVIKENLPPVPHEIQFSSPDSNLAPNILGISNMSLSYFADPTVPNESEEQESEISSINTNKYFSTPMPSKERVKKKLTPVMEVDFESNISEDWQHQDKLSRTDMLPKNLYCADVLSHESPTKTPLYRSFFAAECQEIVNQIEGTETDTKRSPGKRKVEEFDVSTIDAEPPPYDCTPMKSMLACEVAKMMSSLESSPIKEGLSLFGESLLDLEKTDMQLNEFNLSECGIKNNKVHSLSDTEGFSLLSDRLDGVCVKRQKTDPLEKIDWGVNHINQVNKILSPLPNVLDGLTREKSPVQSLSVYTTSRGDEGLTAVISSHVLPTEHKKTDNVSEPAILIQDTVVAPQALVSTTRSIAPIHEGTTSACIGQLNDEDKHKQSASTTQDIVLNYDELPPTDTTHVIEENKASTNSRQHITSLHEEMTTANATQVIEILPFTSNTTQDIPCVQEEVNIANTTQVIEMAGLPSSNTTQDIALVPDNAISGNTTQIMDVLPLSANTTQDITPIHDVVTTANTTQIIEVGPQFPANTTQDVPPVYESKTANTTCEIEVVPQSCANTTQDIASMHEAVLTTNTTQVIENDPKTSASIAQGGTSAHEEIITTGSTQHVGVIQKSIMEVLSPDEVTPTCCADVPKAPCNANESAESHNKTMPTTHDHLLKEVTQSALNMVFNGPAQHSVVISDINPPGTTGADTEISASNSGYDLNAESKKLKLDDHKNLSNHDPSQETLVVNDVKECPSGEPEAQTVFDLTHATIDPSTLVSPPAQAKLNVTEGHTLEGYEKKINSCTGMASTYKESRNRPLLSESCSMIQEEENAHDVSVFSVGSLSFVTSTPVPGLNNFQFQKTSRDSVQQDPNVSIGSVLDDSANRVPGEQRMITQHRSHDPQGLNCKDKGKQEGSRGSFLPPSMQRSMAPPSEAVSKQMASTSAIPSARRSLAMYQNTSQNPAKEPAVSKFAPRSGIPGRGMIRPPMARQSLSRASLGNPKQGVECTGGNGVANKLAGNRFRTPKAAAAVVKGKSATTHSQLPVAPSSAKPPSRLGAPGTSARPAIGGQNASVNLHDTPSGETVSVVRPPISGIRTGLLRPGTSSIRPPLPQSQKVSPKHKSQVQGLPTKKNQRELPTLSSRREIGSKAESTSVRSTAKQATLALDVTNEAASIQASIQASSSPNCIVQPKVENPENVQSPLSSKEETASIPAISSELAEPGHERCLHLETCKCCHVRYRQLLQENEELKRRLGQVHRTQLEMTHMSCT